MELFVLNINGKKEKRKKIHKLIWPSSWVWVFFLLNFLLLCTPNHFPILVATSLRVEWFVGNNKNNFNCISDIDSSQIFEYVLRILIVKQREFIFFYRFFVTKLTFFLNIFFLYRESLHDNWYSYHRNCIKYRVTKYHRLLWRWYAEN